MNALAETIREWAWNVREGVAGDELADAMEAEAERLTVEGIRLPPPKEEEARG